MAASQGYRVSGAREPWLPRRRGGFPATRHTRGPQTRAARSSSKKGSLLGGPQATCGCHRYPPRMRRRDRPGETIAGRSTSGGAGTRWWGCPDAGPPRAEGSALGDHDPVGAGVRNVVLGRLEYEQLLQSVQHLRLVGGDVMRLGPVVRRVKLPHVVVERRPRRVLAAALAVSAGSSLVGLACGRGGLLAVQRTS